jgi:hypothetical protein
MNVPDPSKEVTTHHPRQYFSDSIAYWVVKVLRFFADAFLRLEPPIKISRSILSGKFSISFFAYMIKTQISLTTGSKYRC